MGNELLFAAHAVGGAALLWLGVILFSAAMSALAEMQGWDRVHAAVCLIAALIGLGVATFGIAVASYGVRTL